MPNQIIVTISREFGSGGHEIAEKVAAALNLKFYDRNILEEVVGDKLEAGILSEYDEKPDGFFSIKLGEFGTSTQSAVSRMQFDFLKKKAAEGESFVVVGRCSEWLLKGTEGLYTFFVLSNKEDKVLRICNKYGLSEEDALAKMQRNDKTRKQYHNSHTDIKWGDSRGYDMCINSAVLGVDGTVKTIVDFVKAGEALREADKANE